MREPLDRLDPNKTSFDGWEVVLYFISLSFIIEGEPLCLVKVRALLTVTLARRLQGVTYATVAEWMAELRPL